MKKKSEIGRLNYMLKWRDERLKKMEEEQKGYQGLLSAMSSYVAYFILKESGSVKIPKSEIADILGKYKCTAKEEDDNYIITVQL